MTGTPTGVAWFTDQVLAAAAPADLTAGRLY
jgi:hypothetical protein